MTHDHGSPGDLAHDRGQAALLDVQDLVPVVGQRRHAPTSARPVVVVNRVDYAQCVAWLHRETDGYPVARGEPVAFSALEGWPVIELVEIVLRWHETPPSMNAKDGGYKPAHNANRKVSYAIQSAPKKKWQTRILEPLLLVHRARMPRAPVAGVEAHVVLTFAKPANRDVENYRPLLSKALGDAMQAVGLIANDSAAHWKLVSLDLERGDRDETVIRITWPKSL